MSQLQKSRRIDELSDTVEKAMTEEAGDDAQRKAAEREAKKAEVRKRLEEAGKKKAKKGFLTPDRKKKLRKLLMIKAAEDLKRQQLLKEQERQKALADRTIPLPNVDSIEDKGQLEKVYGDLWNRLTQLEAEKYDINQIVTQTEAELNALSIAVNDLRGKYVKPSLKKVSKYDNKFKQATDNKKGGGKEDFRANLKIVKKDVMESIVNVKKDKDKPEWSKKGKEAKTEEAPAAAAAEPEPVSEAAPEAPEAEPVEEEEAGDE